VNLPKFYGFSARMRIGVEVLIKGISHITFVVKDLELTTAFFESIFDAKTVYSSSTAKYFQINDEIWLAINKGEPSAERSYNHVAFQINDDEFDGYIEKISDLGLEIVQGRSRIVGEGRSIYFYDFDNHLFELHTGTLDERLNAYLQSENINV